MQKTILITGAGSGIGLDAALALAKRGHSVIATTETQEQAVALAAIAKDHGLSMQTRLLDITNEYDRQSVADYDLDVLINVAGIGETGPLAEVPMQRVRKNFETNVFATLAITQVALQKMLAQHFGTVIVVSSVAGRTPTAFMSPYSMTKYALSGGMAAMRDEIHHIEPNVHISLIEPGAYATGFNQRMFATKYEWLDRDSYFWPIINDLKHKDEQFKRIEMQSTKSIVRKVVCAVESRRPRLRYVAPWYQGVFIQLLRILGK